MRGWVFERHLVRSKRAFNLQAIDHFGPGRAESVGIVQRWRGLRLVTADASVLMPAIRACHRTSFAASGDQRLFALYLPDSELTLHASVHSADASERAMLMQALACLGPDDVLLLDRGYPAGWLVSFGRHWPYA